MHLRPSNLFTLSAAVTSVLAVAIPSTLQLATKRAPIARVALSVYRTNTDLQWYGNISVGSPPQTHSVMFDTSASYFALPSSTCGSSCSTKTPFNAFKSKTFINTSTSMFIDRSTSLDTLPLTRNAYQMQTNVGKDTVNVAGVQASSASLALVTWQTANFAPKPFDGVLGLPYDGSGFLSHLSAGGLESLFTLYLPTSGKASLTLGSIDKTLYSGAINYAPLLSGATNWTVHAASISVNGKSDPALQDLTVTVDNSVPNVLAPFSVTTAVYSLISPSIQGIDFGVFGAPCTSLESLPGNITVDIALVDGSGKTFTVSIPASEFNLGPLAGDINECQTFINGYGVDGPVILGSSLLKHWFTVWDFGNKRIGFATPK